MTFVNRCIDIDFFDRETDAQTETMFIAAANEQPENFHLIPDIRYPGRRKQEGEKKIRTMYKIIT